MKVNIVVHWKAAKMTGTRRRAIHRMALYLRSIKGWSLATKLDAAADVNYVFGYADRWKTETDPWAKYRRWEGPLAGYFTHQESFGIKHRLWEQAAQTVGLRVAESRKYAQLLEHYGPTEQAVIPIERDMFWPKPLVPNGPPRIGVSGYCPISGRKGTTLVYELTRYRPARNWVVVAAGRGWPVPTKRYRWHDLPRFYQSIHVYLCSSLCEGGPLGVFEALACGVPVVIPKDVGALDELPEVHGVYRYGVGDFDAMYAALRKCVGELGTHDRQALRDLTRDMTPQRFCLDHQRIFEKHFGGKHDSRTRDTTSDSLQCQGHGNTTRLEGPECLDRQDEHHHEPAV